MDQDPRYQMGLSKARETMTIADVVWIVVPTLIVLALGLVALYSISLWA